MTESLLRELLAAVDRRRRVAMATVVDTDRSVPRRAGSKMLVYGDGTTSGSVGGGEMESRVVAESAAALADGKPRRLAYDLLDPSSGDPGVCGGSVELYIEPYMPKPTVFVVGAGHVGKAVVELACWLDLRVVVWDDRPDLVGQLDTPVNTDDDQIVRASGPLSDAIVANPIDAHTSVVMVTRNVALDVDILPQILDTPASYIGLMGSHRRWETTRAKLADLGHSGTSLSRITAPIGIEIDAETPAEIAVSILGQVIAQSNITRD